ncbi:hypothetical protein BNJ_00370 [Kaumoebavirus]|uniref:hypothetical protein n=1 Tax=Kaumoebavirus TaxID=1859492 RepID=UPI0009C21E2E|nr:hypothetical protein BNJ_00370 [Kaumoebavirus]ARA72190.1 hypothetical protein BNJ_00370 [Kaumoebavirus]
MEVKVGHGCKSSKYVFINHGKHSFTKVCNLILANDYSFAYLDGFIVSAKKKKPCGCL